MPRYHFDVHDGVEAPDTVGTDLPNAEAARAHAMQIAAAYAGSPSAAGDGGTIVVDVRESDGKPALTVRLVATVETA